MAANLEMKENDIQVEHASAGQEAPLAPPESSPTKPALVDTVHEDEAMKVFANYDGDETWNTAEEKQLRKKIDRRLLPILCLTYALQYYDKGMISQAVSVLTSVSNLYMIDIFLGNFWPQRRP